jgi:DNA-binding HxlR family transcriptional regulator
LELFGDRWSLLVVRELLRGVTQFNELERSLPGISRSTLAQRLRRLESAAIIERQSDRDGRRTQYDLTAAGRDLGRVIHAMSDWGVRWLVPAVGPSQIEPEGLMIWISRRVMLRELPARRVVIRFELLGSGHRSFWLVLRSAEVSLCPEHPGFQEDVVVSAAPAGLYRLVVGQLSLEDAVARGVVRVDGPAAMVRSFPRWFLLRASGPPIEPGTNRRTG